MKNNAPEVDGFYWVRLGYSSPPQVVMHTRGSELGPRVHFAGFRPLSLAIFQKQYPMAEWGKLLEPDVELEPLP